MPDREVVCKGLVVDWKGIFDIEELYKQMKFWLDFNNYGNEKKNFKEIKYVEKFTRAGKNYEIKWKAERIENDYFSFVIEVGLLGIAIKDIEVQKEGRKLKLNQGEIELRFTAYLNKNRKDKFKVDIIKKIYERIRRDVMEQYKIDLYKHVYGFRDEIKSFLELHRY